MSSSNNLFTVLLYQPLLNILILLYQYLPLHDFGIAVIVLTVMIRLLFYPLMARSIKNQKTLKKLQPKIQEIQEKYKQDKQRQAEALLELYKKEKFNPFSGLLPILVQLPVLIALFNVFRRGLGAEQMVYLYPFIAQPPLINTTFLGLIDLSESCSGQTGLLIPNVILVVLVGIAQFFQTKMTMPETQKTKQEDNPIAQVSKTMQKQMLYFFPFFTVFILWKLPAVIGLYWLISTLFSFFQQYLIFKKPS